MSYAQPLPLAPPGPVTRALVVLFLLGLYLGFAARLPGGIPVPAVLAGLAGMLLLLTQMHRVEERQFTALVGIIILYVLSVLSASDYQFLGERFKGLVQLVYSMLIGYAVFLATTQYSRERLARVFFGFSIVILVGCLLENFTPLKNVSDAFRQMVFETGVYTADLRDQVFYGRVRPKFFTSEPSAVTFIFSLFMFCWYVLSRRRFKVLGYLFLLGAGYFLMRGPTLLIGVALIPVYELLLASRRGPPGQSRIHLPRAIGMTALGVALLIGAAIVAQQLYAERVEAIVSGQDPSFFSRIIAPPLVAFKVLSENPVAGAGLTGWEFIEGITRQVYASAQWLSTDYRFGDAAQAITNYFWLHWIYLGLFWGGVLLVALVLFLTTLGVPSLLFCALVWAFFGQGAGSYVGPQAWTVLFLAAAISVIHERERAPRLVFYRAPARRPERPKAWAEPRLISGAR